MGDPVVGACAQAMTILSEVIAIRKATHVTTSNGGPWLVRLRSPEDDDGVGSDRHV